MTEGENFSDNFGRRQMCRFIKGVDRELIRSKTSERRRWGELLIP